MPEQHDPGRDLRALSDLLTPMALRVAATLRIADRLAAGPRTASELAEAAAADATALDRLLRHLAVKGVFSVDGSGRFGLTALGQGLCDEESGGLRSLLDLDGALGRADLSLVQLLHSVRTGEAAFPLQFGRSFWDYIGAEAGLTASFDAQMAADAAAWAEAVVPAFDWGSLGHVIDVGGGNGTLLAAMLRAYPELHGTVFDQPATVEAARRQFAANGLAGRAGVVAGSFFEPLPADAGGYLLTAILHDWNDDAAGAILRRCAEAAGMGGRVFVIEKPGAGGESVSTTMDLRLLAYFAGRERGVAALTELAEGAGLRVVALHAAGAIAIVELTAA